MRAAGSERMHALDAVRGFALLLGVFLHSAQAYTPNIGGWSITDDPSVVTSGIVYVIHIFRMTTFYFIAGFFGRLALERKGDRAFVLDRLSRVLAPLIVGWPIIKIALTGAAKYYGMRVAGVEGLPYEWVHPWISPGQANILTGFAWGHLWFLYVLALFYVGALLARWTANAVGLGPALGRVWDALVGLLVRSHLAPLVLGLPFVGYLLWQRAWAPWSGIAPPMFGFAPSAEGLLAHAMAFGLGWLVHRQLELIRIWERRWALNLALALVSTGICYWMVGRTEPAFIPAPWTAAGAPYAILYMIAAWSWLFAIMGVALKFLSGYSAIRRYVADSSYWIYLVHLPLVMALGVAVSGLSIPPEAKYVIVLAIGFPICFLTYHLFVRYSFIGRMLNGRRMRPTSGPDDGSGPGERPQPSPAAG